MTDTRALIERILGGDREAFAVLVHEHERLVAQIVFRLIPNRHDREDICQDVFVRVYQSLGSFLYQSKLSTWIGRIAYNTCLNHLDKKKVPLFEDSAPENVSIDDNEGWLPTPEEWTEARQSSMRLCEEIDRLPVLFGTIISLYHLHQMTYLEIAEVLSLPVGTVKSYLFRGRKLLKERMLVRYRRDELCA